MLLLPPPPSPLLSSGGTHTYIDAVAQRPPPQNTLGTHEAWPIFGCYYCYCSESYCCCCYSESCCWWWCCTLPLALSTASMLMLASIPPPKAHAGCIQKALPAELFGATAHIAAGAARTLCSSSSSPPSLGCWRALLEGHGVGGGGV